MFKTRVTYSVEGDPVRRSVVFEHEYPADKHHAIRAIVRQEAPNDADPFPDEPNTTIKKVLRKYKVSDVKTSDVEGDENSDDA
jgi:hypothetical protein